MKYRYLIINEWDAVWGTNDVNKALEAAEENQVVDCETGEALDYDGAREAIDEYDVPSEE